MAQAPMRVVAMVAASRRKAEVRGARSCSQAQERCGRPGMEWSGEGGRLASLLAVAWPATLAALMTVARLAGLPLAGARLAGAARAALREAAALLRLWTVLGARLCSARQVQHVPA